MNQPHLLPNETTPTGPVTCLGLTFADDAERRAHFTELLREKLLDPAFRAIEGFPIGADEAILALSDPPYYTACPNPWLGEFIEEWQERPVVSDQWSVTSEEGGLATDHSPLATGHYHREPFAADVSEGKNDPIYNAHSYHTKVPHKAIMRYILHYTEPGDIVFDGFCGTGMTGVAAQLCGDRKAVEALGYRVDGDGVVHDGDKAISRLGARRAVLNDLSPAATFIAYNYNTPVDVAAFEREARRILKEVEAELGWMYETWHPHVDDPKRVKGKINYTVWSDVFVCPECAGEVVFFEVAIDRKTGKVQDKFKCQSCGVMLKKQELTRFESYSIDPITGTVLKTSVQNPVLLNISLGKERLNRPPNENDLALIDKIEAFSIPYRYPTDRIDRDLDIWYERDYRSLGVYSLDHFFTSRNLAWLSAINSKIGSAQGNVRPSLLASFTGVLQIASRMSSFRYDSRNPKNTAGGILKGALYIPSISKEAHVADLWKRRLRAIVAMKRAICSFQKGASIISTSSSTSLPLPENSLDYVFLDPPFGSNLIYSELSLVWEAWLGVYTRDDEEAVVHRRRKARRTLTQYRELMSACFSEAYRLLKPGGWMTVEFSNTNASIWNSIQTALTEAGFVVANVSALDKKQGSFKAVTTPTAVKQDLVISAYKPNGGFEERFALVAESAEGVWEFVRSHLRYLPVVKESDAGFQRIPERDPRILYDQVVAYYIRHGYPVPLSSQEFQQGLARRFDARDGMYFLKEQVPAYDAARLRAGQPAQLALFVSDEKSSIQWLRQQLDPALGGRPQTYQEIQPAFLRGLHQAAHEALPELRDLLQDSFLQDESGRWHAPDPNKAEDLERLRRRALLAEFETYLGGKGKLKQFRAEAVRAGFADAWRRKEFGLILKVAERLPERVVQEDPDLLMYYDTASLRN